MEEGLALSERRKTSMETTQTHDDVTDDVTSTMETQWDSLDEYTSTDDVMISERQEEYDQNDSEEEVDDTADLEFDLDQDMAEEELEEDEEEEEENPTNHTRRRHRQNGERLFHLSSLNQNFLLARHSGIQRLPARSAIEPGGSAEVFLLAKKHSHD